MLSSARLLLGLVALAGASPVGSAAAGYDLSTKPAVRATRGALAPRVIPTARPDPRFGAKPVLWGRPATRMIPTATGVTSP